MGYRSDVAYAIRFKNKEHRVRFMAVQFMSEWVKPEEFSLVDDTTILFNKSGLKWYDEYEDVKQHSQILIDAKEQGCSYEFCRVGEDIGDIVFESEYGIDDEGYDMNIPDIVCPTQYIYVETEGEPYPIGETLDTP